MAACFFYAAFVMAFRYAGFYRRETRWKVALETWGMVGFITWVCLYTGGLASPLLNTYLLPVITSALTLGKVTTLIEVRDDDGQRLTHDPTAVDCQSVLRTQGELRVLEIDEFLGRHVHGDLLLVANTTGGPAGGGSATLCRGSCCSHTAFHRGRN